MISMVHCAHIRIEQCVYYSDLNSGLVVLKWYACRVGFDGFSFSLAQSSRQSSLCIVDTPNYQKLRAVFVSLLVCDLRDLRETSAAPGAARAAGLPNAARAPLARARGRLERRWLWRKCSLRHVRVGGQIRPRCRLPPSLNGWCWQPLSDGRCLRRPFARAQSECGLVRPPRKYLWCRAGLLARSHHGRSPHEHRGHALLSAFSSSATWARPL